MKTCPYCGNAMNDEALFCARCGKRYIAPAPQPQPAPAPQPQPAPAPKPSAAAPARSLKSGPDYRLTVLFLLMVTGICLSLHGTVTTLFIGRRVSAAALAGQSFLSQALQLPQSLILFLTPVLLFVTAFTKDQATKILLNILRFAVPGILALSALFMLAVPNLFIRFYSGGGNASAFAAAGTIGSFRVAGILLFLLTAGVTVIGILIHPKQWWLYLAICFGIAFFLLFILIILYAARANAVYTSAAFSGILIPVIRVFPVVGVVSAELSRK